MSVQGRSRRFTDPVALPIVILTLALVVNFFWRATLFTGNNLPPVVLLAVGFVGLWFLHGLGVTGELILRIPRILMPICLYVAAVLFSIVVRMDFEDRTIQFVLRLLVLLALTLLIANVVPNLESLETALTLLIAGFTLAAIYGFVDYVVNGRYFLNIFVGIDRKNASGYYFMAIMPFIYYWVRGGANLTKLHNRALLAALALCFGAMLLTLARSALVGLLAGMAMVFLLYNRRITRKAVMIAAALALGGFLLAPPSVKYRLGTTFNFQQRAATSNSSRIILLNAGLRMAADYPLLGVGIGRFDENLDSYVTPRERSLLGFETYEASHNQYVAALNDGGVVALFAIVWLLFEILWSLHKRLRRPDLPRRYLFMALAAFWWSQTAHFFVEWQLARELFWFLLGLTGAAVALTSDSPLTTGVAETSSDGAEPAATGAG